MFTLTSLCAVTLIASFIGSLFGCLIGGTGVARQARRHAKELESDLLSLEERFTRDQKKKAGLANVASREERIAEAHRIAATAGAVQQQNFLPGRMHRQ